ncbi:MAG: acyl-CoA thioesterase [Tidjanibacter sp.]|jgi:acyl-CoA thioester hydrolase|nr:acyl-CoA thioesterase [Tidjanibacter sp.]
MKTTTKIQQRFADSDTLGHINNIHLQEYFDLGKMELYATLLGDRIDWRGVNLVLVSIKTDMMRQTRLGDDIVVESWVEKIGTKSMTVRQRLINKADGEANAECSTVVVCFDFASQRAIPFPDEWRTILESALE